MSHKVTSIDEKYQNLTQRLAEDPWYTIQEFVRNMDEDQLKEYYEEEVCGKCGTWFTQADYDHAQEADTYLCIPCFNKEKEELNGK